MIFACNPVQRGWDVTITTGSCINRPALYIATAGLGIFTDIVLLAIPIPVILRLQMPSTEKILTLFVFVVGSATLVTSIVRLVVLIPVLTNIDQTWAISFPCMWICVETSLLTICAALPTIRKFVAHFTKKPTSASAAQSDNSSSNKKPSLRTWGAAGTRRRYDRFGEESEFDMKTLDKGEEDQPELRPDVRPNHHGGIEVRVGAHNISWDSRSEVDAESQRGIVQTRTTTIQRSDGGIIL
ncbi:hypothetical protein E8E14_009560 [Neopestalotiopsis sp. 37M]|nr:hypothetical protein E8E14_009560 [Neopestalotiopsis sp. 37M]